jgi:DNA-binding NarL/FixJ family response regulator
MPPRDERARVLLVDDDALVRAGLRLLLERAFGFVVREAATAGEARAIAKDLPLALALIDVRLEGEDGIALLRWFRGSRADVPCVMLSGQDSGPSVREALSLGARGYVIKGATPAQFREAIEVASGAGGVYIHPRVAAHLLDAREGDAGLTYREGRILAELARGASTEDIAAAVAASTKTVKADLTSIYRKLGVENRTEAVAVAVRRGLI